MTNVTPATAVTVVHGVLRWHVHHVNMAGKSTSILSLTKLIVMFVGADETANPVVLRKHVLQNVPMAVAMVIAELIVSVTMVIRYVLRSHLHGRNH